MSGSKASVAKAKQLIRKVLDAPRTFPPLDEDVESIIIDVGSSAARVIGRSGATMRKIQNDTGAKLDFLEQECRIAGDNEQIEAARKAVQDILEAEAKREANRKRIAEERAAAAA